MNEQTERVSDGAEAALEVRDPDELMPQAAAARLLGVSERYLEKARVSGDGPPFVRVSSRCIRYRRRDLVAWCDARLRQSTSDTGSNSQ